MFFIIIQSLRAFRRDRLALGHQGRQERLRWEQLGSRVVLLARASTMHEYRSPPPEHVRRPGRSALHSAPRELIIEPRELAFERAAVKVLSHIAREG